MLCYLIKSEVIKNSIAWKVGFHIHIIFGGIALLIGWTQFIPKIKVNKVKWHRQLGKIYVVSAFIRAIAGVGIGFFATGGVISAVGFTSLGFFWPNTTFRGYTTILSGFVARHKTWMIYSYSACFAAVTLRIWMPVLGLLFEEFVTGY